jgi:hypothetical protein
MAVQWAVIWGGPGLMIPATAHLALGERVGEVTYA